MVCFSQSGVSKVSKPKYPAVMTTVENLVDWGTCETSFSPTLDSETSIPVSQVILVSDGGAGDLEVPNTWVVGCFEYRAAREAPSPRVAPTMRMLLLILADVGIYLMFKFLRRMLELKRGDGISSESWVLHLCRSV